MTPRPNAPVKSGGKIPWYVFFVGAILYVIFASWLFTEDDSSGLAWLCIISSPVGFFFAWRAWKQDQQK
jgi:hypothetical protein